MYDISYTIVHTCVRWPALFVQVGKIDDKVSNNRFGGSKDISTDALAAANDVFAKIKFIGIAYSYFLLVQHVSLFFGMLKSKFWRAGVTQTEVQA